MSGLWVAFLAFLVSLGSVSAVQAANPIYVLLAKQITLNSIKAAPSEATNELKARDGSGTFHVESEPTLVARDLKSAAVTERPGKNPLLAITLTPEAAARMKAFGKRQLGKRVALVFAGRLMKAPHLNEPFKDQGIQLEISSMKDARLIADLINAIGDR